MKESFQKYVQAVQSYAQEHKKDISTGVPIIVSLTVLFGIVAFATYHNAPKIDYPPTKACDLLTPGEAQSLLGEKINGVDKNEPKISDDLATSNCGYSDLNEDANSMMVAAVAVRSGINDKGVAKNKAEFAAAKRNNQVEVVKDLGDSAFFNKVNGKLNIYSGYNWIILSYGLGNSPEANTLEKSIELAHKVLAK